MGANMGIGNLGLPGLVFVRQYRFLISGEHLGDDFNFSVHIDYVKKIIKIAAYEVIDDGVIPIHEWADGMEAGKYLDETLLLVTLDGCGKELYRRRFWGLDITGRENAFNYSSSDVTTHEVTLRYEGCEKEATQDRTCVVVQ